jgi:hypothetical protein
VTDVRRADFGCADRIVILDVLHYIAYADQHSILERAHRALVAGGVLLLRIGDASGGFGFTVGKWMDQMVLLAIPMSKGTAFANVLSVARPR